jgi:hypothetical protein
MNTAQHNCSAATHCTTDIAKSATRWTKSGVQGMSTTFVLEVEATARPLSALLILFNAVLVFFWNSGQDS